MQDKDDNEQDWCYRSETAQLLALSVAQIHTSLTEGGQSVSTLTHSFEQLAALCNKEDTSSHSTNELQQASHHVTDAIVAFQFYDRLCQRMEHVADSLEKLSGLIGSQEQLQNPAGWSDLRKHIRSAYTMEAEHLMYEAIMQGESTAQALKIYREALEKLDPAEDIELF